MEQTRFIMESVTFCYLRRTFFLCIFITGYGACAFAYQPIWSPAGTKIPGDRVAFFTHNSTKWDFQGHGAGGANALAEWAAGAQIPRVYMMDEYNNGYYLAKAPDFLFHSNSGEFIGEVAASEMYFAGAYLEACLSQTVKDTISQSVRNNGNQNIKITFITDGIRSGEEEMAEDSVAKAKLLAYYSRNSYSYPNLQEDLNVIGDADEIHSYLLRFLEHRSSTYNLQGFSHKILVSYQGTVFAVFKEGTSNHTMTFDFSDSRSLTTK